MQEWLTYDEAAERLGTTTEAIRQRVKRGRWPRTRGNDGRARIQLPEDIGDRTTPGQRPAKTGRRPDATGQPTALRTADDRLISALEAHIETLKADLALARAELVQERKTTVELVSTNQAQAAELAELRAKAAFLVPRPPPIPRAPAVPPRPASRPPAPKPAPADTDEETAAGATPPEQVDEAQAITGGSAVRPPVAPPVQDEIAAGMAAIKRRLELQLARRRLEELGGDYDS